MSAADTSETFRPLLFSIAYRMLGSAMEAEDMVQEAYLRFMDADLETIRSPKAYLSTVVTRQCLDHLKSAKMQREEYVGPWLPEPMLTEGALAASSAPSPDNLLSRIEDISLAFLVMLESLSPVERAVFLLREVFDYDYSDIADIVDKSEANCRQLYSRAKSHISAGKPRFHPPKEKQQRLLGQFFDAVTSGDLSGLQSMLAEDASLWSDGGGKVAAAIRPLFGADVIARFMVGIASRAPDGIRTSFHEINGSPAAIIREDGNIRLVVTMVSDGAHIHELRLISNPDKLRYLERQMGR